MNYSVVAIGLSAVSNASNVDVTEETIMAVLKTGDGPGGIVRALFGDCSLETLDRLGSRIRDDASGPLRLVRDREGASCGG